MKDPLPMQPTSYSDLGLILFSVDEKLVQRAVSADVDGFMVDWENQAKKARQKNFDTEINLHTFDDLCRLRSIVPAGKLICRINGFNGEQTFREADQAIQGGADEVFLPMVTAPEQASDLLNHCAKAVDVSILIETTSALNHLEALAALPLKRVYIGLNDLHIQQGTPNLFYPLTDGTITKIRRHFKQPVGLGGVTHPCGGKPISSLELIKTYAQHSINFSFLRRTFLSDCQKFDMEEIVTSIRETYRTATARKADEVADDFDNICRKIRQWENHPSRV
jgi:hypothetical protein